MIASVAVVVDTEARCWQCGRVLFAYAARPWELKCRRCNARNRSRPHDDALDVSPQSTNPVD